MSVPEVIAHYQRSIEKSENDRPRLLHCISKLYKLGITVQHLQETGIGRTVNSLRKDEGEVGVAAKALVAKWKAMVAEAESSDEEMPQDNDIDGTGKPNSKTDIGNKRKHSDSPSEQKAPQNGNKPDLILKDTARSNTHHKDSHLKTNKITSPVSSSNKSVDSSSSEEQYNRSAAAAGKDCNKYNKVESNIKSNNNGGQDASASGNSRKHDDSGKMKRNHKTSSTSTSHIDSSTRNDKHSRSNKSHSSGKDIDIGIGSENSSDDHRKRSSHSPHKRSSKSSSSNSEKNDKKSIKHSSSDHEKRKHQTSHHHSSTSGERRHSRESSSPKKQKLSRRKEVDEIDSSMGTSFADALGMITPAKSKSTSKQQKTSQKAIATPSTSQFVPPEKKSSASTSEKKSDIISKMPQPPKLLSSSIKLPPLEQEIALELPSISNNYKPMPLNPIVMDCVFKTNVPQVKRTMTEEEFGATISSKTMRTKVYSGVKSGAPLTIPSLYDLCLRVLQKNITGLAYTGGVPFDILKPILETATPTQLFTLEDYNAYLIEDTDPLWEQHCKRQFRSQKRHEFETWRELFLRCTEEQDKRLSNLTENIKMQQAVAVPLKKTKIAFVDSMVKPPRNVIKKQHQFGTERKLVATPAARVPTLVNATSNIAQLGDTRLKVLAGMRDTAQVSVGGNSMLRMKKAPLMAKTLQLMKGRFKR